LAGLTVGLARDPAPWSPSTVAAPP